MSLILVGTSLAGCLSGGEPPEPQDVDPEPVEEIIKGLPDGVPDPFLLHDLETHADPTEHELSWNMLQTLHHPLGGNALKSSGAHVVEIQDNWLFVGAYGAAADVDGGIWTFSLHKDPFQPELVSTLRLPGNLGGDRSLEATEDAEYVVLGTEAFDCAGHLNPFAPGLYLADMRDKELPRFVDYIPGTGIHSVTIHRIDGEDYVFTVGGSPNVLHIDKSGPVARLVGIATMSTGHDTTALDDPVTGTPLLLVAGGGGPLSVYDISDPANSQLLGQWNTEDRDEVERYFHAAELTMVDGHRIIVIESEDWGSLSSPLWTLNADNWEDIHMVGEWTNPSDAPANANADQEGTGSLAFSTHNPRVEDNIIYMAHYHAGVWMFDINSTAKLETPQVLGYYLPHADTGLRPQSSQGAYPAPNICNFALTEIPNVFDLEVQEGIVYAADLHTGLYVLESPYTTAGGHDHPHEE